MIRTQSCPARSTRLGIVAVAIAVATFAIDLMTPRGVAMGVFPYFIPIFLTSWMCWTIAPFVCALGATLFTFLGFLLTTGGNTGIILTNRVFIVGALWLIAVMAYLHIRQNAALIESRAAAESDRRFRTLIEGSVLGVHIATATKRVFVNQALADMLGYDSIEELLNAPQNAIVAPYDLENALLRRKLLQSGEEPPRVYEFDGTRKDGSIIRLQGTWRWIDWEGEKAISRVFMDVTDRKRAQTALAENEERMRTLIDSLEEGVIGTDGNGLCTFINPSALCILGYGNAGDVIGKDMHTLIHHSRADGRTIDRAECAIVKHRENGTPYRSEDDVFWRADGTSFPVSYRILPLSGESGSRGSVAVFSDLTADRENQKIVRERDRTVRELQSELRRSTQVNAMGQVSAIMAHELHQPLTAVLNTAHAIRRWTQSAATDRKEILEEMVPLLCEQAEKAGQVVRRIRNLFEKGETGTTPSDLNAVIEETCTLVAVEFQSANVRINRRFDRDLPKVPIDRVQMQQVVYNLLRNAVEASADLPDHDIVVATRRATDGNAVEVCVRDAGLGLPAEQAGDIFQPFVTTKSRGMGLGLYTCKTILEAHGGSIWATPNSDGGTTFHFTIPTGDANQPNAP